MAVTIRLDNVVHSNRLSKGGYSTCRKGQSYSRRSGQQGKRTCLGILWGVFNTPQQVGTATINVRNIPAGVYVLRVTDGEGKEYRQKIVRK
ncbi:MAG: T9SS type A sorting domain-containing protein [Bacteroidales bacterium]|nr:T9SS type A sorting domain-containing protein [Bacteroidales bacterium]